METCLNCSDKIRNNGYSVRPNTMQCSRPRKVAVVRPLMATSTFSVSKTSAINVRLSNDDQRTTPSSSSSPPVLPSLRRDERTRSSSSSRALLVRPSDSPLTLLPQIINSRNIFPVDDDTAAAILNSDVTDSSNSTYENASSSSDDVIIDEQLNRCSFYYGHLSMNGARRLLRSCDEGTFLLRKSSHPDYAHAISVRTKRGTTSIRILRVSGSGEVRLDCDRTQEGAIPTFPDVLQLIEYHLKIDDDDGEGENAGRPQRYVFMESNGRMDTPLILKRPLKRDIDSV